MPLKSTASSLIIPPPTGGWNAKDPLSNMDQMYAIEMENFFPNNGTVDLRNGYRYHSKGINAGVGAVYSLAVLETNSISKLVGVGLDNTVYDCSTAGASATSIQGAVSTGAPFNYFQQYKDNLILSTGVGTTVDSVYRWAGSGNLQGVSYTSSLSGGATRGLGQMTVYRGRLYFVQENDASTVKGTSIFYSLYDSLSGALTEYSFASLLSYGGRATFIGTVTRARNVLEDELFCIATDGGEILVFEGDSPGSTTWRMIGHYYIPSPLGLRAFFYIGPDLHIITRLGVISIQDIMGGIRTGSRYRTISENIDPAIAAVVTEAGTYDNLYWLGINYPKGNQVIINVPITSGSVSHQYVANSTTGSWCKFTGQNAFSWAVWNQDLYFGGLNGRVFKADNGYFDEDPASEGSALTRTLKLRPAYNFFGDPYKVKQFTEATPYIYMSEGLSLTMDVDCDFANTTATSTETDLTDTSYKLYTPTMGLNGLGQCASIRIDQTATTKRISLQATKVTWNDGDIK